MISNTNMVLAKTDLPIATPYAELLEERRTKNDAKCDEDGRHCLVLRADAGTRAVVPAGSGNRSLRPGGGHRHDRPAVRSATGREPRRKVDCREYQRGKRNHRDGGSGGRRARPNDAG